MIRSELTILEQSIAREDGSDLGAGYPLGIAFSWARLGGLTQAANAPSLVDIVRSRLGIPSTADIHTTLSGSLALQRAFVAAKQYLGELARPVVCVTTDPCIDIIPAIAREFSCHIVGVTYGLRAIYDDDDCDRLCRTIITASDHSAVIAVLTSPENPTGAIWSKAHLQRLSRVCHETGSVLIVDHCFILAGVQEAGAVNPIWLDIEAAAPVLGVWDTGKTVHLDQMKLGFVVTAHRELSKSVRDAISVIQFGIPEVLTSTIGGILAHEEFNSLVSTLHEVSVKNQQRLEQFAAAAGVAVHRPLAGTFGLVQLGEQNLPSIGIPFSNFCLNVKGSKGWRRVALARSTSVFTRALERGNGRQ